MDAEVLLWTAGLITGTFAVVVLILTVDRPRRRDANYPVSIELCSYRYCGFVRAWGCEICIPHLLEELCTEVINCHEKRRAKSLNITLSEPIDRDESFPQEDDMNLDLRDGMKVLATLQPTDAEGNPASVEGTTWGSDNPALVSVTQSDDGLSAVISSVPGPGVGSAVVTVTADADLGDGVRTITETLTVNVIPGDASALGILIGAEEPRDEPAPPVPDEEPPAETPPSEEPPV